MLSDMQAKRMSVIILYNILSLAREVESPAKTASLSPQTNACSKNLIMINPAIPNWFSK